MRGLIGAALLFVLLGAVHGSHDRLARSHVRDIRDLHRNKIIAERQQSNCTFPPDVDSCTSAIENLDTHPSSEDLANAFDEFCTPECIQPYGDYANCLGNPQLATVYNNLNCGKNGNQYCLVISNEDSMIQDDIECVPYNGTCNESCKSMQKSVVDDWGCCAASYYASTKAKCDVGAGDVCDGVVDAGFVNRVGLGLIMIFTMVAASANAALF